MTRILLVEDNPENFDMLSRRLERKGYEIIHAVDGQQAIDLAASHQPELILMDIGLPVLDGLEATKILRAKSETAHTPIIALTAHAMDGDRQRILAAGCDDYHSKPVDLKRLLEQIETRLASSNEKH